MKRSSEKAMFAKKNRGSAIHSSDVDWKENMFKKLKNRGFKDTTIAVKIKEQERKNSGNWRKCSHCHREGGINQIQKDGSRKLLCVRCASA